MMDATVCQYVSTRILSDRDNAIQLTVHITQDKHGFCREVEASCLSSDTLAMFRKRIKGNCKAYMDDFHFRSKTGRVIPRDREAKLEVFQIVLKPNVLGIQRKTNSYFSPEKLLIHWGSIWKSPLICVSSKPEVNDRPFATGRSFVPWSFIAPPSSHTGPLCDMFDACISGDTVGLACLLDKYESHLSWEMLVDIRGLSLLHYASQLGHVDACHMLLNRIGHEEGLLLKDRQDSTPLLTALAWGRYNVAGAFLTLDDCPVDERNCFGRDVAFFMDTISHNHFKQCVKDTSLEGKSSAFLQTCIYRAALSGEYRILKALLESLEEDVKGLSHVNKLSISHILAAYPEQHSKTMLDRRWRDTKAQSKTNKEKILEMLVNHGEEYKRDLEDHLPLWHAARAGNVYLISGLIENIKQDDLSSALTAAILYKRLDSAVAILRTCPDVISYKEVRSLIYHVIQNDWTVYSKLLKHINDQEICEYFLSHACRTGNVDIVLAILSQNVHLDKQDMMGLTALHEAVQGFKFSIVQILLDGGADVNMCDGRGDTPLHHLCMSKAVINEKESADYMQTVECIVSCDKLNPNMKNAQGRTPMLEAIHYDNIRVQEILLEKLSPQLYLDAVDRYGVAYGSCAPPYRLESPAVATGDLTHHDNQPKTGQNDDIYNTLSKPEIPPYTESNLKTCFKCVECHRHFANFGDAGRCHKDYITTSYPARAPIYEIQYQCTQCIQHMQKEYCEDFGLAKDYYRSHDQKELRRYHCYPLEMEVPKCEPRAAKPWSCFACRVNYTHHRSPYCIRHKTTLTKRIFVKKDVSGNQYDSTLLKGKSGIGRLPLRLIRSLMTSKAATRLGIRWERSQSSSLRKPFSLHLQCPVKSGATSLHHAIQRRVVNEVEAIVGSRKDLLYTEDDHGRQPLELAIDLLETKLVELLVKHVNPENCPSALHRCVSIVCTGDGDEQFKYPEKHKLQIMRILLSSGWSHCGILNSKGNVGNVCHMWFTKYFFSQHLDHMKDTMPIEIALLMQDNASLKVLLGYETCETKGIFLLAVKHSVCQTLQTVLEDMKKKYSTSEMNDLLKSDMGFDAAIESLVNNRIKEEQCFQMVIDFVLQYIDCHEILRSMFSHLHSYYHNQFKQSKRDLVTLLDNTLSSLVHRWSRYNNQETIKIGRRHTTVHLCCFYFITAFQCRLWKTVEYLQCMGLGEDYLDCITRHSDDGCEALLYSENKIERLPRYLKHDYLLSLIVQNRFIPVEILARHLTTLQNVCEPLEFACDKYAESHFVKHHRNMWDARTTQVINDMKAMQPVKGFLITFAIYIILTKGKYPYTLTIKDGDPLDIQIDKTKFKIKRSEQHHCHTRKGFQWHKNADRVSASVLVACLRVDATVTMQVLAIMMKNGSSLDKTSALHSDELCREDKDLVAATLVLISRAFAQDIPLFPNILLLCDSKELLHILWESANKNEMKLNFPVKFGKVGVDRSEIVFSLTEMLAVTGKWDALVEAVEELNLEEIRKLKALSTAYHFLKHKVYEHRYHEVCYSNRNYMTYKCRHNCEVYPFGHAAPDESVSLQLLKTLHDRGGDMDYMDARCGTPLYGACFAGNLNVVKYLLQEGAALSSGYQNRSPFRIAMEQGHVEIVRILLDKSENNFTSLLTTDETVSAILVIACHMHMWGIAFSLLNAAQVHPQIVITLKDIYIGKSALHYCVIANRLDMVRSLLAIAYANRNLDLSDSSGCTALWYASAYGYWPIVELLLVHGAKRSNGCRTYVISKLIEKNEASTSGKPNMARENSRTKMRHSFRLPTNEPFSRMMFYANFQSSVFHMACRFGDIPVIQCCIKERPNMMSDLDTKGRSGIFNALINTHSDVVSFLINQESSTLGHREPLLLAHLLPRCNHKLEHIIGVKPKSIRYRDFRNLKRYYSSARTMEQLRIMAEIVYVLSEMITQQDDAIVISEKKVKLEGNKDIEKILYQTLYSCQDPDIVAKSMLCGLFLGDGNVAGKIPLSRYSSGWQKLIGNITNQPNPADVFLLFHKRDRVTSCVIDLVKDEATSLSFLSSSLLVHHKCRTEIKAILAGSTSPIKREVLDLFLLSACSDGDEGILQNVLAGNNYPRRDIPVLTAALHLATAKGHVRLVKQLLKAGVNPFDELRSSNTFKYALQEGQSALHVASKHNQSVILQTFLEQASRYPNFSEIVLLAASSGSKDIVKYIMEVHKDEFFNGSINTEMVFWTAVNKGHDDICMMLYEEFGEKIRKSGLHNTDRILQYASLYKCERILSVLYPKHSKQLLSQKFADTGPNPYAANGHLHIFIEDVKIIPKSPIKKLAKNTKNDVKYLRGESFRNLVRLGTTKLYNKQTQGHEFKTRHFKNVPSLFPKSYRTKHPKTLFIVRHLFEMQNDTLLVSILSQIQILTNTKKEITDILQTLLVWACASNCVLTLKKLFEFCRARQTPASVVLGGALQNQLAQIMIRRRYVALLDMFLGEVGKEIFKSDHAETTNMKLVCLASLYGDADTLDTILKHGGQGLLKAKDPIGLVPYDYALSFGNINMTDKLKPENIKCEDHDKGHLGETGYSELPIFSCTKCLQCLNYGLLKCEKTPPAHVRDWMILNLRRIIGEEMYCIEPGNPIEIRATREYRFLLTTARHKKYKITVKYKTTRRFYNDLRNNLLGGKRLKSLIETISTFFAIEKCRKGVDHGDTNLLDEYLPRLTEALFTHILNYSVINGTKEVVQHILKNMELNRPSITHATMEVSLFQTAIQFGKLDTAAVLPAYDKTISADLAMGFPIHIQWLLGISKPTEKNWPITTFQNPNTSNRLNEADIWLIMIARYGLRTIQAIRRIDLPAVWPKVSSKSFLEAPSIFLPAVTMTVTVDENLRESLIGLTRNRGIATAILCSGVMFRRVHAEVKENHFVMDSKDEYIEEKSKSIKKIHLQLTNDVPEADEIKDDALTRTFLIPKEISQPVLSSCLQANTFDEYCNLRIEETTQWLKEQLSGTFDSDIGVDVTTFPRQHLVEPRHLRRIVTNMLLDCSTMMDLAGEISGAVFREELLGHMRSVRRIKLVYDDRVHERPVPRLWELFGLSSVTWEFCLSDTGTLCSERWNFPLWILAKLYSNLACYVQVPINRLAYPGKGSWRFYFPTVLRHIWRQWYGYRGALKRTQKLDEMERKLAKNPMHYHINDPDFDSNDVCSKKSCAKSILQSNVLQAFSVDIDWESFDVLGDSKQVIRNVLPSVHITVSYITLVIHSDRQTFTPLCDRVAISHGITPSLQLQGNTLKIVGDFGSKTITSRLDDLLCSLLGWSHRYLPEELSEETQQMYVSHQDETLEGEMEKMKEFLMFVLSEKLDMSCHIEVDKSTFPAGKYARCADDLVARRLNGASFGGLVSALQDAVFMSSTLDAISGSHITHQLMSLLKGISKIRIVFDQSVLDRPTPTLGHILSSDTATWALSFNDDGHYTCNRWSFSIWVLFKLFLTASLHTQAVANLLSLPGNGSWRWYAEAFVVKRKFPKHIWCLMKKEERCSKRCPLRKFLYSPAHFQFDDTNLTWILCRDKKSFSKIRKTYNGAKVLDHVDLEILWKTFVDVRALERMTPIVSQMQCLLRSLVDAYGRLWVTFRPMCTKVSIAHGQHPEVLSRDSTIYIVNNFLQDEVSEDILKAIAETVLKQSVQFICSDTSMMALEAQMKLQGGVPRDRKSLIVQAEHVIKQLGIIPFEAMLKSDS